MRGVAGVMGVLGDRLTLVLTGWMPARLGRWRRAVRWLAPLSDGARGERVAAHWLRQQGYRILRANLASRVGEVDLLAQAPDQRTIVFVEVKTSRRQLGPLRPEVRVGRAKQQRLARLASHWTRRLRLGDRPVRFDVVGVTLGQSDKPEVRHIPGAFESHL